MGTTVSSRLLIRELERSTDCVPIVIDSRPFRVPVMESALNALVVSFRMLLSLRKCDVATFHASVRGIRTFGYVADAFCRLFRKPLVLRVFGGGLIEDAEHPNHRRAFRHLFSRRLVLVQTKRLQRYVESAVPEARVQWFPTHRPSREFSMKDRRTDRSGLVFVSRISVAKGIDVLADAARQLPGDVAVDVYGPVESDYRGMDDWPPNMTWHGPVEPESVATVLEGCLALILPTFYPGEGYPGVVLESFSVSTPAIVTDWLALSELVEDGRNGLVIPVRDSSALVSAIRRLTEEDGLLEQLQDGAGSSFDDFRSDVWARRFVDFCEAEIDAR